MMLAVQGQRNLDRAHGNRGVVKGHHSQLTDELIYATLAQHGIHRQGGSLPRCGNGARDQRIPGA